EVFPSLGVRATKIVLTVGRLSPEKNLPVIIAAAAQLGVHLVIAGDGPERPALEKACAGKPNVSFVGLQQGDVLRRLYATASAFVFASQIDTLGLATMEAMSSGVPVIVPRGTAIAELVEHGISGYCYEPGGLAAAISEVLACPVARARLAANGRRAMVDRWSKVRFADTWGAMVRSA